MYDDIESVKINKLIGDALWGDDIGCPIPYSTAIPYSTSIFWAWSVAREMADNPQFEKWWSEVDLYRYTETGAARLICLEALSALGVDI